MSVWPRLVIMLNRNGGTRAAVATAVIALLGALAVAVPLLDVVADGGPYAVSASQDTGRLDHDHRICLQHGAMAWLAGVGASAPVEARPTADVPSVPAGEPPHVVVLSSYHPRAPPRL